MTWEKEPQQEKKPSVTPTQEVNDLLNSMNEVINSAIQVKELQKDHQASIDNLRQQYFMMQEAADKYQFLQENQYIKYDLLELQELLV